MTAWFIAQMCTTHLSASLHIPISETQKDEDASLECYAESMGATVTNVLKNHSAFILTVRQSKQNSTHLPNDKAYHAT